MGRRAGRPQPCEESCCCWPLLFRDSPGACFTLAVLCCAVASAGGARSICALLSAAVCFGGTEASGGPTGGLGFAFGRRGLQPEEVPHRAQRELCVLYSLSEVPAGAQCIRSERASKPLQSAERIAMHEAVSL